jgi:hypothetical protein
MAKKAIELVFDGTTLTTPYTTYDSTKINVGNLIQQFTADKFAGPFPITLARSMEQSTAIASQYPHVIEWSSDIYWIFLADLSTAAATRRIVLYTYTKSSDIISWNGFITLTYPPNTVHIIRGMRAVRSLYTTGTASASGTSVTGAGGAAFQTARLAAGARIGFGSTDPTQITTWYTISSIGSQTAITLVENAGTIGSGSYVIEELRIYTTTTNATTTNGGLFVAKGVNYGDFSTGGTTIAAATTTDNLKAVYWLADAATVTNIAAGGCAISDTLTDTSHDVYVVNVNAATTPSVFKYNARATLSGLSAGKSTSAFICKTGLSTVAGTVSQTNGSRVVTCNHGPGAGVASLYFATTTRIVRAKLTDIIDASTTWVSDCMVEIPTGGSSTFTASSLISSVEYVPTIDRFVVFTGAARHYVTKYNANVEAMDHVMLSTNYQLNQVSADVGITPYPNTNAGFSGWVEKGIAVFARTGTTAALNVVFVFPLGADWQYASGLTANDQQRLITPAFDVSDSTKFYRVYVNHAQYLGSVNLGIQPEPFRVYYRTSGIENDTGSWKLISDTGDLSELQGVSKIQFMLEFRIIGPFCIPAKIYSLTCVYEDASTDSHYQPSVLFSKTNIARFAWRFATAFGGTVPTLTIRIYDALTNNLLLIDTTTSQSKGLFEKSVNDGSSWSSYNTTDKGNELTYIRYTPTTFGTGIKAKAILSQG